MLGQNGRDRLTTASWCQRTTTSTCSEARERMRKQNDRSSEPMTDTTNRGYRRRSVTSIATRCTVFAIGTGNPSAIAAVDAAQRLRGDAVETVMQTADFRNGNDATG